MKDPDALNMDRLRTEFKTAYENYVAEGKAMTELLLRTHRDGLSALPKDIEFQQERLNIAKQNWETARRRYVDAVLSPDDGSSSHL